MPWCIEPSTLRLTVLDEWGEVTEELNGSDIEKEVSSMATVLSTVPVHSLVSLRMDSRKETLLAMIAFFRRGTPFIVVATDRPPPTRWTMENGRTVVERAREDLDQLEPGIAYSICTSGTTGARKRVDVAEECIRANVEDFKRRFSFSSSSSLPHSILLCTSFHFDPSMVDVLLWATTPGTHLLLLEREAARSPAALPVAIMCRGATFVQLCPSLLARCPLSSLRRLLQPQTTMRVMLMGGEPFPLHLINAVRHPDCPTRIYDVYGITEVSCWATVAEVPHGATTVTLGEPIDDTEITVDDERRLLIGGARRRCIVDGIREGDWTNSGDRVERVEGGWRIAGREGDEVKLHGVRVNLAHAACQLERIRGNADTVRFAKFVVHRSNFLVLFVQGEVSREKVDSVLPPGLSVHHIERIKEVPLNTSGKADLPALLRLLDRPPVINETTLMEELKKLGISPPFDENRTLAELGMDSAGMLRLAFALDNEVCTKLILGGDVKMRELMEAVRREGEEGDTPSSTTSGLSWPAQSTVQLEENEDQRSSVIERWSHPMEKCVDAAPLIVRRPAGFLVIIGSHSGLVVCMEEKEGVAALKWSARVSHRVETAAVETGEGRIAVCSYDGVVTCFDVETGEEWWRYECEASVRGGLVVYHGFVYIGDYEGRLHKIDITKRRRVWCTVVGGAIRAPPTVEGRWAATVSIQGVTTVVNTETGAIVWTNEGRKRPIFAAGLFLRAGSRTENRLVTVDVDGHATMRNAESGEEIQSISIDERVFTTPLQIESNICIVTASDAGKSSSILVLSETLSLLKRIDFASSTTVSIYHTPIVRDQSIMIMASSGMLITVPLKSLTDEKSDGSSVASKRLLPSGGPPIFSPPRFVSDDVIVIGTRDDVVVSLLF